MTAAPSLWLRYYDDTPGDILMQGVCVPSEGLTKNTYYCALQWNAGQNGGGYCGIQDHPDGRNYIFSIWDPQGSNEPIKAAFTGPGTKVENFGGEGTGLKSWNFELGWEPNNWYTLVTRRWDENNHSYFGLWVYDKTNAKWTHLITMDFPISYIVFNTTTGSFLEDWLNSGQNARSVKFGGGYKRSMDGSWHPFKEASFSMNGTGNYKDCYNAMADKDFYFLQSGGADTSPSNNVENGTVFEHTQSPEPPFAPIEFDLGQVTSQEVHWIVPESSVPQFRFSVIVDGETAATDVDAGKRSLVLESAASSSIEVELEDLLGRVTSRTYNFGSQQDIVDLNSSVRKEQSERGSGGAGVETKGEKTRVSSNNKSQTGSSSCCSVQ